MYMSSTNNYDSVSEGLIEGRDRTLGKESR